MVWGTYSEKNPPSSNGHLLEFGGSKCLPGWFGAFFLEKELTTLRNGKTRPEKVSQSARLSEEGGFPYLTDFPSLISIKKCLLKTTSSRRAKKRRAPIQFIFVA